VTTIYRRPPLGISAREYGVPVAVPGSEPLDMSSAPWAALVEMIEAGRPAVANAYGAV